MNCAVGRTCVVKAAASILLSFTVIVPAVGAISFGLETYIPPFVWKDGKTLSEVRHLSPRKQRLWALTQENFKAYTKWGGQWDVVVVDQWRAGDAQLARLGKIVENLRNAGVTPVFRLMESPSVYSHLSATESPQYGFNKEYYQWVRSLALRFSSLVSTYLVGNETELGILPNVHEGPAGQKRMFVTYSQYRKVLATAVKAIKSVNAKLLVGDSGFSDKSLALAVAADLDARKGLISAHAFWAKWKATGGNHVEGLIGVYRLIHNEANQRKIRFVKQAIADPAGSDILQFHYYGGWSALPQTLHWLREQMTSSGHVRPIVGAEVGYLLGARRVRQNGHVYWETDLNDYSQTVQAENTVKSFSLLLGDGVQKILYWDMRRAKARGLVAPLFRFTNSPDDFTPTDAALAFRVLSRNLTGLKLSGSALADQPGLTHIHFTGARSVSVVWAASPLRMTIPKNLVSAEDMYGKVLPLHGTIRIGAAPIYLLWATAVSPSTDASSTPAFRS